MSSLLWAAVSARALLLAAASGLLLLLAFVILIFNLGFIRQMRAGPQPVSASYLRQATNPAADARQWVSFTPGAMNQLGAWQTTRRGKVVGTTHLVLLQVEDRWMSAEIPGDRPAGPLVGYLSTSRSERVQSKVDESTPALAGAGSLAPCHFDATYDYASQCRSMLFFVVLLLVLGVVAAVVALGDWVKGCRAAALSAEMVGERVRRRKRKDS